MRNVERRENRYYEFICSVAVTVVVFTSNVTPVFRTNQSFLGGFSASLPHALLLPSTI